MTDRDRIVRTAGAAPRSAREAAARRPVARPREKSGQIDQPRPRAEGERPEGGPGARGMDADDVQAGIPPEPGRRVLHAGSEGDEDRRKKAGHASAATVTLIFAVTSECSF